MIKITTSNYDHVIDGHFLTGYTDYKVAVESFYPLINQLDIQRKIQSEKFYKRLEIDLTKNCIMPPLTLALIDDKKLRGSSITECEKYINNNIKNAFVLDGIQRLNTLKRVFDKNDLKLTNPIFLNIIICSSRDNLLYRMVTLNNGQKPMTARHQIEVLATHIYDFEGMGINIITEKETAKRRPRYVFKKADIISSYIAFLSGTTNLESSKIIEQKMDELIARKIIESNITNDEMEFGDVVKEISRLSKDDFIYGWFKNLNNLMGFTVGIKESLKSIRNTSIEEFKDSLLNFEEAFKNFDVSKIKLSRERRKLTYHLFANYNKFETADSDELLLSFNELD